MSSITTCKIDGLPKRTPHPLLTRFAQNNAGLTLKAALSIAAVYLFTRLLCLLLAETNAESLQDPGWLYARAVHRPPIPSPKKLRLNVTSANQADLPTIDILIPCCGEADDIILDTVRTARAIHYPSSHARIVLLDDTNSPVLRTAIAALNLPRHRNIHYHTRGPKTNTTDFDKAGNLNHALSTLPNPAPFIAVLDADTLAHPDFLRATLPHLLANPRVALVGSPQHYYNIPPADPLHQSFTWYVQLLTPSLNAYGLAMATGSGFVVRRSALTTINGFSNLTSTEDIMLSCAFHNADYHVLVLPEVIQYGLAPPSLKGYSFQQSRWASGLAAGLLALRDGPRNNLPDSLRPRIAFQGFRHLWSHFYRVVALLGVPLAVCSGKALVPGVVLRMQTVLACWVLALMWLLEGMRVAGAGFRVGVFAHFEGIWLAGETSSPLYTSSSQNSHAETNLKAETEPNHP
ncbi:nucleotide-diphospho-sugar transferase [Aspergillus campestris IBT 28561]|uniref:Nucleotide-diphospho-sugar transferase n=1 Tax=Aspergillus campestris (strain IBT 28561) TaxID=1392248 RepID=A0A2I1CQP5_ASPC2|nr:nucleotide-diphospho-sugar transferase [Aspergillus campestris IBT 28561]PKX99945.1 nucleotide-diphospho-sugar transferase [Aspergillus campestris IBT 28561]